MQDQQFSCIIPIYRDNYQTLDRCLFHLKEQDWQNIEVIIVYNSPDKKSSVETKKILKKERKWLTYKEVDAGYFPKLKAGNHCNAFNKGADLATGDYLLFLDPDINILPGILREYAEAFLAHPEASFVYGDYDFEGGGRILGRRFNAYELRCANYISGAFPIRRSAFRGWDTSILSLQDWDMWLSALDDGATGFYFERPCFTAAVPEESGISAEGASNWLERYARVREKHGFPVSDTVVTSLGAPDHATAVAEALGVDSRVLSNLFVFKPHTYTTVYLVGFYSQAGPDDPLQAVRQHLGLFYEGSDLKGTLLPGKKIIHWIGTDIFMLQHRTSWMGVQFITKMLSDPELGLIHLTECQATHDELQELGIESQIVPLPPKRLFAPLPLPEQFTIGIYINPTQDMYFESFMYELAAALPDIQFKFFGNRYLQKKDGNREWVGWVADMDQFYPRISALIRLTVHDGLPLGPVEAMMAGRQVITTQPLKFGVTHTLKNGQPDMATLIEQIRGLQDSTLDPAAPDYWRDMMNPERFKTTLQKLLQ